MEAETVTIQVDPSTAAILEDIREKAEEHGVPFDALSLAMSRQVLELFAITAHQADLLTEHEVMEILSLEDREELYEFFKRYDVRSKYTTEDFQREGAALDALLTKHGR
jgi:hypothetical protein